MTDKRQTIVRRSTWPDTASRPLVTPLQPSVVYASDDPDALDAQYLDGSGFTYAREGHPNATVLAEKIDFLEGATGGMVTGSGMSAISAVFLGALKAGDHVLGGNQLYGRTLRLMTQDLPRLGIETSLADTTNVDLMRAAVRPNTKMIVVEVVSNPTIRIADMPGIIALAKDIGALLVVDNTFTTPLGYRPFDHGADIIVHSVTKLLAGHSDATLGYVACASPQVRKAIYDANVTWGMTPSPFDCWLAERGLLSFELRHRQAQENAQKLAAALCDQNSVLRVLHPDRDDHPDHNRASSILAAGGNMLSFEIEGGRAAANRFVRAASNIAFAPTLGDIGTTLSHPASSSHRGLTAQERKNSGISEGFFRVSVGVEPVDLLIEEFIGALDAVH